MKIKKIIACAVSAAMLIGAVPQAAVLAQGTTASKVYTAQTDSQDDIFQYHFAGGTDAFMSGAATTGYAYDAYLWVPNNTAPGELKSLVAIKANLVEIPLVYSSKLKAALETRNSGILFIVSKKDSMRYNNTLSSFRTRKDYAGNATTFTADNFTTDGKDAAQIMDDILSGIAAASGYTEIKDTTPLITIGHSAASPFGYRSGNWNKDRIIAQVQMKNGMDGATYQVPGIPSLQFAAQYTEHDKNKGRDRSVVDARWHIANEREKNTNNLVSHIIEWGSGHYDWSDNATDIMVKYIEKAIDCRVPANYSSTHKLNDLTNTGYLMKPFEKDGNSERPLNYYKDTLKGWLSSGQSNSGATDADKKASYWYFDKEFADYVNSFTSYAIPPSPGSNDTKVEGATYSALEPYMLMKNPTVSTYANTPASSLTEIAPMTPFNADMSRYGSNRFVNYEKMANPTGNASNSANLQGYDTVTADTYYMSKIPSVTTNDNKTLAYDGAGEAANVPPSNTKAELVPLMAPYEIVKSEIVDMDGMTKADGNTEAENVASVTRTTLRFHNNRVYYRAGNPYTNEYGTQLDSFGEILSPEIKDVNGVVTSAFKSTGIQMNVSYVNKGTAQTLKLDTIPNISIKGVTENPKVDVNYTSTDKDLEKYTDVFVEYGPAKEIRTVNADGSYSWQIEVLLDEIPENASYPIEINVVASNLGKWETTYGATTSQKVYITDKEVKSGVYLDGTEKNSYDTAVNDAIADNNAHTITVYSDSTTAQRSNMDSSENITFVNGDFAAEVKQTSNNMMFLNTGGSTAPNLTFGKSDVTATSKDTALTFNMDGKNRFAEINKGSFNLYNGVIITGGTAARGGGIDVKTGSTLNMCGGIISGNTATNSDNTNLGGGGVSIVGSGVMNMTGGTITGNTSTGSYGGGVSVMENGSTLNMSGGTISGNTGYDVYMSSKNTSINLSGSAKIGSLYLAEGKTLTVNAPFTTSGSHAEITPGTYTEGAAVVKYADGVIPSTTDFTIAKDGETSWYTYVDGQNLKITSNAPYSITGDGNVTVQSSATKGEKVIVTVPDGYVENSLVVSTVKNTAITQVSDKTYSFTMPENAVQVSCLVNNDPTKIVVVGTHSTYYAKSDNPMNVDFAVPALDNGYIYKSAEVKIPSRANQSNAVNMTAKMNGESYTVTTASISGTGTVMPGVTNTMTVTHEGTGGVDYYSYIGGWNNTGYDYPVTAENLSTLTLTKGIKAEMTKLTGTGAADADTNSDAVGYYIESLAIPSWNPPLKWQITFKDSKTAETQVNIPTLTGSGNVSLGVILYGTISNGEKTYSTSDIDGITVIE